MSTSLTELVRATQHFNDNTSLISWSTFPCVFERLSWPVRMLIRCNVAKKWCKEQHILPLLQEMATPHLTRYACGQWRQFDEEKLKTLFFFFQEKKSSFSPELSVFLSKSPPSFAEQRSKYQEQFSKNYGALSWFREETFFHYGERIQSLLRKQQHITQHTQKEGSETTLPVEITPQTCIRAEKLIRECTSLRSDIVDVIHQIDSELKRASPIRLEEKEAITSLQNLKENGWDLLAQVEEIILHHPDTVSSVTTEVVFQDLLRANEELKKEILSAINGMKTTLQKTQSSIESARSFVQKQVQLLSRSVDKIPLLPLTSPLREQENRLIKIAREKIKHFRTALSKGPGPGIVLNDLVQEINLCLDLAKSFYAEGSEIETSRQHVLRLSAQVERLLADGLTPHKTEELRAIRSHISELLKTIELSSDRKQKIDQIIHEISEVTLD